MSKRPGRISNVKVRKTENNITKPKIENSSRAYCATYYGDNYYYRRLFPGYGPPGVGCGRARLGERGVDSRELSSRGLS